MDGELRYLDHVNILIRKVFYQLERDSKVLSGGVRQLLVDTVYGPLLHKKIKTAIQHGCARFCYSIVRQAHVTSYLNGKNILKMDARKQMHITCLVQYCNKK